MYNYVYIYMCVCVCSYNKGKYIEIMMVNYPQFRFMILGMPL